ncbi:MAG: amino acid ABC transporter ATP-binding protein [Oscillospiraceae bacterium]|jgi:putative glutamine transport system ATP-binding protein|nr:amino acid ABC transporter ATP-binding protein [Oscillospiraceae bacterium]
MIRLEHVHKSFGKTEVLKDITLTVGEGEKVVILGPSGAGKSTAIRCINGLELPTSGAVYLDNEQLTSKNRVHLVRKHCAMLFQQFNLYPHMTAMKNITLALTKLQHMSKKDAEEVAMRCLETVGLAEKAHSLPSQLSGGQQQRTAIARALATRRKILLFDEPTSALDPEMVGEVLNVMLNLSHEHGITMVIVTHEMGFAKQAADRIVFMEQGEITADDKPDSFFNKPPNERVKQFLSKVLY